jgi:chaperone modulatory protein CbpM
MAEIDTFGVASIVVEEQVTYTLAALCRASGAGPEQVQALVDECLLQPAGRAPPDWRFGGDALARTRRALRLARELELDLAAVALVMDLLAEIDRLRSGRRHE